MQRFARHFINFINSKALNIFVYDLTALNILTSCGQLQTIWKQQQLSHSHSDKQAQYSAEHGIRAFRKHGNKFYVKLAKIICLLKYITNFPCKWNRFLTLWVFWFSAQIMWSRATIIFLIRVVGKNDFVDLLQSDISTFI